MNFSAKNVKPIVEHSNSILTIHQFENNEDDHFISVSADSELKEWVSNKKFEKGNSI
jgi:hypothetical protein